MLELAILGLLADQPLHGYELKKRLTETLGSVWGVSFGSLYPALRRLERAGEIEVVGASPTAPATPIPATGSLGGETAAARLRLVPGGKSGRRKKAYRITTPGEQRLRELLADPDGIDDDRTFAVKLAFCRYLDPTSRIEMLERRRAELTDRLARTRRSRGPAVDRYMRSLVEHRTRGAEADLAWVSQLLDDERADAATTLDPTNKGATA